MNKPTKGFPIKVVANRTGLSPHVIRIWERRYHVVSPDRTQTNRRLYTDADIERFRLLRLATEAGHRISEIALLPAEDLRALVQTDLASVSVKTASAHPRHGEDNGHAEIEALWSGCMDAVKRLDGRGLELLLAQASVAHSQTTIMERLIVPLMNEIGDRWRDGSLRPAHEHLASAIVRGFLSNISHAYHLHEAAPVAVATTPIGQLHEIGALLATATAASEGWSMTYLGPNLPAEDIAAAAKQANTRAIILSVVYPDDDPRVGAELRRLRSLTGPDVSILVGGRAAPAYKDDIAAVAGHLIFDLDQLRHVLRQARSASGHQPA